jgi:hypothetical protein
MFTLITTLVNGYFNNGVMIRPVLYAFLSSILNNTEKNVTENTDNRNKTRY